MIVYNECIKNVRQRSNSDKQKTESKRLSSKETIQKVIKNPVVWMLMRSQIKKFIHTIANYKHTICCCRTTYNYYRLHFIYIQDLMVSDAQLLQKMVLLLLKVYKEI